jgi:lipopolysaccharide biosynthesis glycosyltransferase
VSVYSLLKTKNLETAAYIYCMVPRGTSRCGKRKLRKTIGQFPGCNLIWREVRKKENPFIKFDYKRWSPVIFYRLFAHRVFPDIDRILYLDSDTLIYDDLTEMYNMDIGDNVLAGAIDCALTDNLNDRMGQYVRKFKEKYVKSNFYINSGVLLINLQKRCELDSLSEPIDSSGFLCPDQDLINMKFDGKIARLSLKYNFTYSDVPKDYDPEDAAAARKKYSIYHFYTRKPFFFNGEHRELYDSFIERCHDLGWGQATFLNNEKKYNIPQTHIPCVKLNGNRIKLFGITIARL